MITVNYFNRTNTVTIFNKFVGRSSAEKNIQLYADFGVALTEANTATPITWKSTFYKTASNNFKSVCVRTLRENEYIVGYCVAVADKDPAVICVIGNTEIPEYFSMLIYHKRGNRYATQHRECAEVKQSKKSKFGNCDIFYIFNFYAPIATPREAQPAAPAAVQQVQVTPTQPEPVEQPVEVQEAVKQPVAVAPELVEQVRIEERKEDGININERESAMVDAAHVRFDKSNKRIQDTHRAAEEIAQTARVQEQQRLIAEQPHLYTEEFQMKVVPPVYRLLGLKQFPKSRKVHQKTVDGIEFSYQVVKLTKDAAIQLHQVSEDDLKPEHMVLHMRPVIVTLGMTETHTDYVLVEPTEKFSHSFSPCEDDLIKVCEQRQDIERDELKAREATQQEMIQSAISQKKNNDSRGQLWNTEHTTVNFSEVVTTLPANDWQEVETNETVIDHPMDVIDLVDDLRINGDEDSADAIEALTIDAMAQRQKAINKNNKFQVGA